ncbi:TetR/AcrR family transcriptional regulator [Mycobacterium heckeshornense]|uniref:TetR/AcrR family transcriptional regulator n=1 Tax=Mycobacterium heckeshornense TaxID=110505 RepID=UPI000662A754|nr:TetR/AcrR family transcriptional regulator [Mycobacterium heckeshornense]KMV20882.1 TetR family transcriptional regulator [Mycobacterium heckeshornense]MCV7035338.1 TetR/AcrR family transcriptional regulator [Mycobacterium heckeshornense]PIJ35224.1 TetR/AcrR family transcriptional regulator [Mycobacterium heckeshornense]
MSVASGRPVVPTRRTSAPRKRGDDTRAKIIDETVRCIIEEGFEAATAKHVAERAGVTWGVIQYHFGDRNGLLMAVVDDGVAKLLGSLSSADVSELPLRRRIEVVVDTAWACYSSPTSMAAFEILRATRGGLGQSSRHHLREMNSAINRLGMLISDDPANDGVAEVIWATLRGVVLAQMLTGMPIDWRRERRALIDMVTHYLHRCAPMT